MRRPTPPGSPWRTRQPLRFCSRDSPDIIHTRSRTLVEDVCEVLLKFALRNEVRYHDARFTKLPVDADRVDPPRLPAPLDCEDATEDVEANQWHEAPNALFGVRALVILAIRAWTSSCLEPVRGPVFDDNVAAFDVPRALSPCWRA